MVQTEMALTNMKASHKEGLVRQGMSLAAGILDKSQPLLGHETGDLLAGRPSETNETIYSGISCL